MRSVGWFAVILGACERADFTGPAEVVVGTGVYEYEAVNEGQEVPIIAGPQGGYHVWVGFLARNVRRSNCVVVTTMTLLESEEPVGEPLYSRVDLFEAPDGWVQYAGLQQQFIPEEAENALVRIDLTLTDRDGSEASGMMQVVPRLL